MTTKSKGRMKAIFYDRNNECEVSSDQLVPINLTVDLVSNDKYDPCKECEGFHTIQLGEYGYKSADCPKVQNWDKCATLKDLIFLRLEEI